MCTVQISFPLNSGMFWIFAWFRNIFRYNVIVNIFTRRSGLLQGLSPITHLFCLNSSLFPQPPTIQRKDRRLLYITLVRWQTVKSLILRVTVTSHSYSQLEKEKLSKAGMKALHKYVLFNLLAKAIYLSFYVSLRYFCIHFWFWKLPRMIFCLPTIHDI